MLADERDFAGIKDEQAVIVGNVFENSPITIATGLGVLEDRENGIMIEGPAHHLKFLYPYLVKLLNDSIDGKDFGLWVGVTWSRDKKWLNLFYLFGSSLRDQIELLEHKFRRDAVSSCDLMLNARASLIVRNREKVLVQEIGLPEELSENGKIVFPSFILPPRTIIH